MPEISLHEDLGRKADVRTSSDRSFGVVWAIVCCVAGLAPLRRHQPARWWMLALAGLFLAIALLQPVWLRPLNRVWTKLGLLMGRVMSPVVTSLLFYLVVTPMGFLVRVLRKDLLRLKPDHAAGSYWLERQPPGPAPETMRNQF